MNRTHILALGVFAILGLTTISARADDDKDAAAPPPPNQQFEPSTSSPGPYPQQRAKHEAAIKKNADDFLDERTKHQAAMDAADGDDTKPNDDKTKPVSTTDDSPVVKFGVTPGNTTPEH